MSVIEERDSRLKQIFSNKNITDDMLLVKGALLPRTDKWSSWHDIKYRIQRYIANTVKTFYKLSSEEVDVLSLDEMYANGMISNLPNLTPNGILLPKKETLKYYYPIQCAISLALNELKIPDHIWRIHFPVTIRIVRGLFGEKDSRPRASTKIHTDVWSGEPTNTTMAFIPIHGDFVKAGIDFYETPENIVNWLRPLENYDEGKELTDLVKDRKYPLALQQGKIYLSDPLLLHATHKEKEVEDPTDIPWRISVDFRFISNIECDYDQNYNLRENSYIPYDTWINIGYEYSMFTQGSLYDLHDNTGQAQNAYSEHYELREIF